MLICQVIERQGDCRLHSHSKNFLGFIVAQVQMFIQAISKSASLKIALDAEREMKADFDGTAKEAYLLIVASDVSGNTYGFKECEYVSNINLVFTSY